jgi:CRISPR-associated protein Csm1
MSEQILLQGKILGIEEFLLSPSGAGEDAPDVLAGRAQWISLICEVLPRALLVELGLARILLGSSGGGQFLLVLPGEARGPAQEFLGAAARDVDRLSAGRLGLLWGITENLGDWSVVRKRLNEELHRWNGTPLAGVGMEAFQPYAPPEPVDTGGYFSRQLGLKVREANLIGWSPETPAQVFPAAGPEAAKHTWKLTPNLSADGITCARHAAPADDGGSAADLAALARRAQGAPVWGVLRGDVDGFGVRLRRLQTIEEHVQVSVLYKQFFAGELEVLCSLPEFWKKVTILYAGGDDFAVYGAWDALISLARELQRLFHRFTEENLKDFPGAEGKTISMGLSLSPEASEDSLAAVYEQAGRNLDLAKSAGKDCIHVLGRVLEWKQLGSASELKDLIVRMMGEVRSPRQFLSELRGIYAKMPGAGTVGADPQLKKVWRFHRRLNLILGSAKDREFQKQKTHLIGEIVGRSTTQVKLRPAGLVALQWARLLSEV